MKHNYSSEGNNRFFVKLTVFDETRRFIIVFSERKQFLYWAVFIQSIHLHLGLPSELFSSGFVIKILHVFLFVIRDTHVIFVLFWYSSLILLEIE